MISSPSVSSESEIQAEARAEVRVRKSLRDKGLEGCAGRKKGMSESAGEYGRKKPEERSEGGRPERKQIICGCERERSSRESEPDLGKRTDSEEMSRKARSRTESESGAAEGKVPDGGGKTIGGRNATK